MTLGFSRQSCGLLEPLSAWLLHMWLNSLVSSVTTARCSLASSPGEQFSKIAHLSSLLPTEISSPPEKSIVLTIMIRRRFLHRGLTQQLVLSTLVLLPLEEAASSVNVAPPIVTVGSAQPECNLTCYLVMLSGLISMAPPPEKPCSSSSLCLKPTISSAVHSSSHHRFVSSVQTASTHPGFITTLLRRYASRATSLRTANGSSNNKAASFLQGFHGVKLHCPDLSPSPSPPIVETSPPQGYLFPHLGRVLIFCVLALPLFCVMALANRKEARRSLFVWRLDCSKLFKPAPTDNPDIRSFIPSFSESVNWQPDLSSVKPSWVLHGNAGTRSSCLNFLFVVALEVLVKLHHIFLVVDIVSYLLLDSHSPMSQVSAKSNHLGTFHQGFYGAKQHRLNLYLLVTTGSIVQECCFASFVHDYLTAASLTHYAVSSIDGSSQLWICDFLELLIACFSVISSHIGLRSLNVVFGSGASHLKFLPVNIATCSYRCFNVVFDYQLFERTITMGTKLELLFGSFHFAEHDSPLNGSIFTCFVLFSSFIVPSSISPGSSAFVVNVHAL